VMVEFLVICACNVNNKFYKKLDSQDFIK